ncbi:MAG: SAM-dependent methyltransferase [Saprospiraceae bacterium]|nr:SAM-dependent methyltransferase [Bacteroidia bacterium]NNE15395.1 SAM-dependent methyltransferase [Saprospiraceae bacterium]NNL92251.1 SAM-dependent methyltransferase [Saprospiraceae bacterium]
MAKKGKVYLVPTVISEGTNALLPPQTIEIIHSLSYFIVERARTARRFIKTTNPPYSIDSLEIIEIDNNDPSYLEIGLKWLQNSHSVGIMSESGMPGIADPGEAFIKLAHKHNYEVHPLVGPSSIFMSLAASGLNGQNFAFIGYLPIKEQELKQRLKHLESAVFKHAQTQIFIETPYRNDRMLDYLIKHLNQNISLCVARDISGESEMIICKRISEWKKTKIQIGKIPTIFLLGQ